MDKMPSSKLNNYPIRDLLDWHGREQLIINRDWQRNRVWSQQAKTYLIDTILKGLPIPKMFFRTVTDTQKRTTYREVVDGQQRLLAIHQFANDDLRLGNRAGDYAGLTYSQLPEETQSEFLEYEIAVDSLINANDTDVIDMFARLNTYNVSLTEAELRHAKHQGEFKWSVRQASRKYAYLWDEYKLLTTNARLRMLDDQLIAEMFGILLEGVQDGGQPNINRLYTTYDPSGKFKEQKRIEKSMEVVLSRIRKDLEAALNPPLTAPHHFLMLFAAVAHVEVGLKSGQMGDLMPKRSPNALTDQTVALSNLEKLANLVEEDEQPKDFAAFWNASRSSTQRIASRRERFPIMYQALLPSSL